MISKNFRVADDHYAHIDSIDQRLIYFLSFTDLDLEQLLESIST